VTQKLRSNLEKMHILDAKIELVRKYNRYTFFKLFITFLVTWIFYLIGFVCLCFPFIYDYVQTRKHPDNPSNSTSTQNCSFASCYQVVINVAFETRSLVSFCGVSGRCR